jgi:outer membrane biosynthesis protein TonB
VTAFYLVGMCMTAAAFALIFARRYPRHRGWLVAGIVIGLFAMIIWPLTVWVAIVMWLTGFARPRSQPQRNPLVRKRIALPLATLGGLGSLVVFGATVGPVPPTVAENAPPVAATSAIPTATPTPSPIPATPTTALLSASPTPTPTAAPSPRPQPKLRPAPKPQPKPNPQPQDESNETSDQRSPGSEEESGSSGTRPRTGNSGHPCRPGERDGDNDGYCGER